MGSDLESSAMWFLITTFCALLAPIYVIYRQSKPLIRYFRRRWPDVLWDVSTTKKCIALTIDDGPSEYTTEILEILKTHEATATFFVIGCHIAGREEVLQTLLRNGNELGNHAMRDEPSRSLGDADLREQLFVVQSKIHDIYSAVDIEPPIRYFRPGSGFFRDSSVHECVTL